MIHITSYLYDNKIEVQILDSSLMTNTRNRVVYSRPIKIYQGIDNPLVVEVKNQDQKPVNLTGSTVQVSIQDPVNKEQIASFDVVVTNAAKGLGNIVIAQSLVDSLTQRFYKLTVKTIRQIDDQTYPAYIDQNYSVSLDVEVLEGWYPAV